MEENLAGSAVSKKPQVDGDAGGLHNHAVGEDRNNPRRDFKEAFLLFDKNGDGSISAEELGEFMRGLGKEMKAEELGKMIKNIDADGNGQIDYQEFSEMLSKEDDDSDLMESFRVFDKDGDGFISVQELKQVITSLGEAASEEELKEMLSEADADGDGQVDFDEFVRMLTSAPK